MNFRVFRRVGCALAILVGLALGPAAAQSPSATLHIATRVVPPLVVKSSAGLSGFSIDLWRAVAKEAGLTFDFVEKQTLAQLLDAVRTKEADAAVAAISITAQREEQFDFSQPLLESGLQILVRAPAAELSAFKFLSILTSRTTLEVLLMLFLLTLVPVPLVWWFEHQHGAGMVDTDGGKRRGLAKTMWWSIAVLGGQADEMPKSSIGRVVAVMWMFASVLFISYFTASASTLMTVETLASAIRGPADLPGKKVGTVEGSTAARYLEAEGIQVVGFSDFRSAAAELASKTIDAVVYDAPVLRYYASHEGEGTARVVGARFGDEDYGILLPPGSALRKQINAALLRLRENGTYRSIYRTWFGTDR